MDERCSVREIKIDTKNELNVANEEGVVVRSLADWRRLNKEFNLSDDDLMGYITRIDYMLDEKIMTAILADFAQERVVIYNYVEHPMKRVFGVKKNPDWADFMMFLEDRCVPRSRDRLKWVLRDLQLDFYDPLLIVRKTGDRMAEDRFYLRITDFEVTDYLRL